MVGTSCLRTATGDRGRGLLGLNCGGGVRVVTGKVRMGGVTLGAS